MTDWQSLNYYQNPREPLRPEQGNRKLGLHLTSRLAFAVSGWGRRKPPPQERQTESRGGLKAFATLSH